MKILLSQKLLTLIFLTLINTSIFGQSGSIDFADMTNNVLTQTFTTDNGVEVDMSYGTFGTESFINTTNGVQFGLPCNSSILSNSLPSTMEGLFIHNDYNVSWAQALVGNTLDLNFSESLCNVEFRVGDLTSPAVTSDYPFTSSALAVYTDKVVINGFDGEDNLVAPIITLIGSGYSAINTTFSSNCLLNLDAIPTLAPIAGLELSERSIVGNTAFVKGGFGHTLIGASCFVGAYFNVIDLQVSFPQCVKRVTINYANEDYNGATNIGYEVSIPTSNCLGNNIVQGSMQPQAIIIEDFDYGSILPVELVKFDGVRQEENVLLTWQTVLELNNKGFNVLRSKDGMKFQRVGFIEGKGTSTTYNKYKFYDKKPLAGFNYYKLEQEDFDGAISTSKVIVIDYLALEELTFHPNPVNSLLSITGEMTDKKVSIFDIQGKAIIEEIKNINTIDLTPFERGVYFIQVKVRDQIIRIEKIILQ